MNTTYPSLPYPVTIDHSKFHRSLFNGQDINLSIETGLTTLIGANGTGKTTVMKALRDLLREQNGQDAVRFISAGRMGVLEQYRSNLDGAGNQDSNQTHIGNYSYINYRKQSEGATGDFITLHTKADIRLKVESRLQGLFNKSIKLDWTQSGLKVDFKSLTVDSETYGAGNEASGLTQLVAILAAIYDHEIKFLLLDEPEVSLHPQLQSFILKEILSVTGNPREVGKKCVIISTHSPAMLKVKSASDLPSIVFFRDNPEVPIQIASTDTILTNPNLENLLLRLSETYKIGFFAKSVMLSEGVSDEIVINTLADLRSENFAARGIQVIPVDSKSALPVADRLFTAIGKRVCLLGDLDILDDHTLIRYLDSEKNTASLMSGIGYTNLEALLTEIDTQLVALVPAHETDIFSSPAFTKTLARDPLRKKRQILAFLATSDAATTSTLINSTLWEALRIKLVLLLDQLDKFNLVLIRSGSIEDCYLSPALTGKKPFMAYTEANYLMSSNPTSIDSSYIDILKAINKFNQRSLVDEEALLRAKLGKILGAIDANFTDDLTDEQIDVLIENEDPNLKQIFKIKTATNSVEKYLSIEIVSPLFKAYNTTLTQRKGESISSLMSKLPSAN